MVQLKYYGDDRDYFKYDLISFVLENGTFENYGFVPMLTEHRKDDNEGERKPVLSECKSPELLDFIRKHSKQDLNNWEGWLKKFIPSYKTVSPVNSTYIKNIDRSAYWFKFERVIGAPKALIFFDPDTGIQPGRKTKIRKKYFEKYILDDEFLYLLKQLSLSSVFVIYQHLQRNKKKHESDIKNKHDSILKIDPTLNVLIYSEKDLAFIFLSKTDLIGRLLRDTLEKYKKRSTVKTKTLYPPK